MRSLADADDGRRDRVLDAFGTNEKSLKDDGIPMDSNLPWDETFQFLTRHLLSDALKVDNWRDVGVALLRGRGCVLGWVSSILQAGDEGPEVATIAWKAPSRHFLGGKREWSSDWTLAASTLPTRPGDIIVVLDGAAEPTLIRACENHVKIIRAILSPTDVSRDAITHVVLSSYDFLLFWHCDAPSAESKVEDGQKLPFSYGSSSLFLSEIGLDRTEALFSLGMILRDANQHDSASQVFVEVSRACIAEFSSKNERDGTQIARHHRWRAPKKSHESTLTELFIKHGNGPAALRYAASAGLEAAITLLLNIGEADLRIQGANAPFVLAAKAGHWSIAKLFLLARRSAAQSTPTPHPAASDSGMSKQHNSSQIQDSESTTLGPIECVSETGDQADVTPESPISASSLGLKTPTSAKPYHEASKTTAQSEKANNRKSRYQNPIASITNTLATYEWSHTQSLKPRPRSGLQQHQHQVEDQEEGLTPLIWAVIHNDTSEIDTLLDIGSIDPDGRDAMGRTPLAWATKAGNWKAVGMLIDTGRVDPEAKDRDGLTPLMWAAIIGGDACFEWLGGAKRGKWWTRYRNQRAKSQPAYRDVYEYRLFS